MIQVIDTKRLAELEKQITDYLFERRHEISKPLIIDLAVWAYHYGDKMYIKAQFDTDKFPIPPPTKRRKR